MFSMKSSNSTRFSPTEIVGGGQSNSSSSSRNTSETPDKLIVSNHKATTAPTHLYSVKIILRVGDLNGVRKYKLIPESWLRACGALVFISTDTFRFSQF